MSKLALAHQCAWSFRLDSPRHEREPGAAARIGTLVHTIVEARAKGVDARPDVLAPMADPTELAEAAALASPSLLAFVTSRKWTASEIGLVYDARSDVARVGPTRASGYGSVGAHELPGTLDLVEVRDECVDVLDLKSGKLVQDREQLYGQAVAAARFYGVSKARVGYLYARKTKCDEPQWEELDADRLDEEAGRIAKLLRHLPVSKPVANPDCWKCDSRPSCPAFGAARAEDEARELEAAGFFT